MSPKSASRCATAGSDEPRRAGAGGEAGVQVTAGPVPPAARSPPEHRERRAAPAESASPGRR